MLKRKMRGFTLIELLITIAIIGLLSTIAVTALVAARSTAQTTKVNADLSTIRKAIDLLALDTDEWPGHQQVNVSASGSNNELCNSPDPNCANTLSSGFGGLTQDDSSPDEFPFWNGPYIGLIPLDPWGNEYFFDTDYEVASIKKAVIGSYGPNGGTNNVYNDGDDIILILASE